MGVVGMRSRIRDWYSRCSPESTKRSPKISNHDDGGRLEGSQGKTITLHMRRNADRFAARGLHPNHISSTVFFLVSGTRLWPLAFAAPQVAIKFGIFSVVAYYIGVLLGDFHFPTTNR